MDVLDKIKEVLTERDIERLRNATSKDITKGIEIVSELDSGASLPQVIEKVNTIINSYNNLISNINGS